jgi:hypothetical protein
MRTFSKQEKRILKKIKGLNKRGTKIISPISLLENLLSLRSQLHVIKGENTSQTPKDGSIPLYKIEISGKASDVYKDFFGLTQRILYVSNFIDYLLKEKYLVIKEPNILSSFYINKIESISEELEDEDSGAVKVDLKITSEIETFLEKCSYYYTPTDALIHLIENNFRTENGSRLKIRKPSITSLIDYLFCISPDWSIKLYQLAIHRPIKSESYKTFYHIGNSLTQVKRTPDNTDQVYLSMLED